MSASVSFDCIMIYILSALSWLGWDGLPIVSNIRLKRSGNTQLVKIWVEYSSINHTVRALFHEADRDRKSKLEGLSHQFTTVVMIFNRMRIINQLYHLSSATRQGLSTFNSQWESGGVKELGYLLHGTGYAPWHWICSMLLDMLHDTGYALWYWICSMVLIMLHATRHAPWY